MMAPGTSSMLRARRRDVNVKPNRRLDRKSSRGMLYENEELRLRTININAEVERGQNDIKKLRRENEQLRREIWGLREEYDRLEGLLGKAKRRGHLDSTQDDESENGGECDEEDEYDEEDEENDDDGSHCEHSADLDNEENQQKASSSSIHSAGQSRRNSVKVEFDGLSIVDEETEENQTVSNEFTPVEQNTEEGTYILSAGGLKQGTQFFSNIRQPNVVTNVTGLSGGTFSVQNIRPNSEKPFFGKIKLPNGKEGVFVSDAPLPSTNISNGMTVFNPCNQKGNSDGCGNVIGVGSNDYRFIHDSVWTDVPIAMPGTRQNAAETVLGIFPHPQGHYNYTFTPVDSTFLSNNAPLEDGRVFERHCNAVNFQSVDNKQLNTVVNPEGGRKHPCSEHENKTVLQECQTNDEGYFGMGENIGTATSGDDVCFHRRAGPDFFISGAYPVARSPVSFPIGGNLDQLLKQMSGRDSKVIPTVQNSATETPKSTSDKIIISAESEGKESTQKDETKEVQEVIDTLENQIDSNLNDAVRTVRVIDGNSYVCIVREDSVDTLLENGLSLRGERVNMADETFLTLSGVPHDVSDCCVLRLAAKYGSVVGDVERKFYKGVDTGERHVKLQSFEGNLEGLPSTISLGGSKVILRAYCQNKDERKEPNRTAENKDAKEITEGIPKKGEDIQRLANKELSNKSLETLFGADRFRSQLNVQLKQPNCKTNRSMENICDSSSNREEHNTSLPIIDTCHTKTVKLTPPKFPLETATSLLRDANSLQNINDGEACGAVEYQKNENQPVKFNRISSSDIGHSSDEIIEEQKEMCQKIPSDLLIRLPSQEKRNVSHISQQETHSSPTHIAQILQNTKTDLSDAKQICNTHARTTASKSTESLDSNIQQLPHFKNNPFFDNYIPTSQSKQKLLYQSHRPITPIHINPFIAQTSNPIHQSQFQELEHSDQIKQLHSSKDLSRFQTASLSHCNLTAASPEHQRITIFPHISANLNNPCNQYQQKNTTCPLITHQCNIPFVISESSYPQNDSFSATPSSASKGISTFSPDMPQTNQLHAYFPSLSIPSNIPALVSGTAGYSEHFVSSTPNIASPNLTQLHGVVPPSSNSLPIGEEYFSVLPDVSNQVHACSLSDRQTNITLQTPSANNTTLNLPSIQQIQNSTASALSSSCCNSNKKEIERNTDLTQANPLNLDVPNIQQGSVKQQSSLPSSPILVRKHNTQQKITRKSSNLSHQHSKSSGDEGPNLSPPTPHKQDASNPPPNSPCTGRKKISRKMSCTNSTENYHNVDNSINESNVGSAVTPKATSSPNANHKTSISHNRKSSVGASGEPDTVNGSHTNVTNVSRSSSSGQDSPTKPDRRRRVSIYFNNKKGAGKRRDSVFVPNGSSAAGSGLLSRSLSMDQGHRSTSDIGHCPGAETATCSERERTNSASSRTSSATGSRLRKHSVCSNRGGSANDIGKVPWCGCWGNGCI